MSTPGVDGGLRRLRVATWLLALAVVWVCLTVVPATAAFGAETVVGFDELPSKEPLPPGTSVGAQYASVGLKLGTATELGQPSPGHGDCGPATTREGGSLEPPSKPDFAELRPCEAGGEPGVGTFAQLTDNASGPVSVYVRQLLASAPPAAMELVGYDASGNEIGVQKGTAPPNEWSRITFDPGASKVAFLAIRNSEATRPHIGIDNLAFPANEAPPEEGTTTTSTTVPPPPPTPPTAVATLVTPGPRAGETIALSGAGSTAGSGHIISYEWDFNNDGKIDTSTGTNPEAHLLLTPGPHTIGLTVVNSSGEKASTHLMLPPLLAAKIVIPDGGEGECQSSLEVANTHLLGECIQKNPGGGWVIETGHLGLNGMVLTPVPPRTDIYHVSVKRQLGVGWVYTMTGPESGVELLNTPVGDITLGNYDLETEPMPLGTEVEKRFVLLGDHRARIADEERVANIKGQPLMAFGVGAQCKAGEKKPNCCPPPNLTRACAGIPGGFPLKGMVVVYLSGKGQVTIDVQVGLNLESINFQATGEVEILSSTETGIELSSLRFTIPEASIKPIFKVKEASFVYYSPGNPEPEKRDTWQAKASVTFGVMNAPGLEGELSFQHGNFHSATLVLTLPPPGIPVFTGVYLNKFGGTIGVEPLTVGGLIGAQVAAALELELSFRYQEATETSLGYFGGKGTLKYEDNEIATLEGDVYSDGYSDALLLLKINVPFGSKEPVVSVEGEIGYWDEPSSGLWEAHGRVHAKLWILEGEVAGLVNNKYLAACGYLGPFGALGYWDFETSSAAGEGFVGGNCSNDLKPYKEVPLVKHTNGFVNETETESLHGRSVGLPDIERATIAVAHDPLGSDLRISAAAGTPIVKLTGPHGETFTTPSTAGKVVTSGNSFAAALGTSGHDVIVYLGSSSGGEWHLKRAPGSAPITKVETAEVAPPTKVRARVRRRGRHWSLSYSARNLVPGEKLRFYERGKDSIHALRTVTAAHGTIAFTPAQGLARARRIYATTIAPTGAPGQTLTATTYAAPAPTRPRRVTHLRFKRAGRTAVLTWSPVPGCREYAVIIHGSDGRLVTRFPSRSQHTVVLPNVLPFESFAAKVTAIGGPDLLSGPAASAKLRAVPKKRSSRHASGKGRRKK